MICPPLIPPSQTLRLFGANRSLLLRCVCKVWLCGTGLTSLCCRPMWDSICESVIVLVALLLIMSVFFVAVVIFYMWCWWSWSVVSCFLGCSRSSFARWVSMDPCIVIISRNRYRSRRASSRLVSRRMLKGCLDLRCKIQSSTYYAEMCKILNKRRAWRSKWQQPIDDRLQPTQHLSDSLEHQFELRSRSHVAMSNDGMTEIATGERGVGVDGGSIDDAHPNPQKGYTNASKAPPVLILRGYEARCAGPFMCTWLSSEQQIPARIDPAFTTAPPRQLTT